MGAALASYDAIRRPATAQLILMNRANGPEQVMELAEERAPEGFDNIHTIIPREEQAAGFTLRDVNQQP